jgi:hypothetical protein
VALVRERSSSDRHLSAKLVPNFVGVVSATDPHGRILGSLDWSRYYFLQVAPQLYSRGRVGPVPDPHFSENLVAPGIEHGTSGSVAGNSDH